MPQYNTCQMCGSTREVVCTDCRGNGYWLGRKCLKCKGRGAHPCPDCTDGKLEPKFRRYIKK